MASVKKRRNSSLVHLEKLQAVNLALLDEIRQDILSQSVLVIRLRFSNGTLYPLRYRSLSFFLNVLTDYIYLVKYYSSLVIKVPFDVSELFIELVLVVTEQSNYYNPLTNYNKILFQNRLCAFPQSE